MSRIITSMICPHCNEEWKGYISFGHPDADFDYKWKCEKCGGENTEHIKAWIDMSRGKSCNGTAIYEFDSASFIRVFRLEILDGEMTTIPLKDFEWKSCETEQENECFGGYLTLEDISDQIKKRFETNYIGVWYVWVESPLYGVIYQYGNYSDDSWHTHGKTNGYA